MSYKKLKISFFTSAKTTAVLDMYMSPLSVLEYRIVRMSEAFWKMRITKLQYFMLDEVLDVMAAPCWLCSFSPLSKSFFISQKCLIWTLEGRKNRFKYNLLEQSSHSFLHTKKTHHLFWTKRKKYLTLEKQKQTIKQKHIKNKTERRPNCPHATHKKIQNYQY